METEQGELTGNTSQEFRMNKELKREQFKPDVVYNIDGQNM